MSMRYSTLLLGLCLAIGTAGLLSPAVAQQWVMTRTPDGHPDLQGNWSNATLTPLQRGRNQEGPVLNAEQVGQRTATSSTLSRATRTVRHRRRASRSSVTTRSFTIEVT